MKKRLLFVSLFLVSILFISSCAESQFAPDKNTLRFPGDGNDNGDEDDIPDDELVEPSEEGDVGGGSFSLDCEYLSFEEDCASVDKNCAFLVIEEKEVWYDSNDGNCIGKQVETDYRMFFTDCEDTILPGVEACTPNLEWSEPFYGDNQPSVEFVGKMCC